MLTKQDETKIEEIVLRVSSQVMKEAFQDFYDNIFEPFANHVLGKLEVNDRHHMEIKEKFLENDLAHKKIEKRFDSVETKLVNVETRLIKVETRVVRIEQSQDRMEEKISLITGHVLGHEKRIRKLEREDKAN